MSIYVPRCASARRDQKTLIGVINGLVQHLDRFVYLTGLDHSCGDKQRRVANAVYKTY